MEVLNKLLTPWRVIGFIILLVVCTVAHLYLANCQASKWHYILQRYYCPSWYKPNLDFPQKEGYLEWRTWHKNGQLEAVTINKKNADSFTQEWDEKGQLDYEYNSKENRQILNIKSWIDRKINHELFYDNLKNIKGQCLIRTWYSNENKRSEHVRVKSICSHEFEPDSLSGLELNGRNVALIAWHENGQLKKKFKFKTGTLYFTYNFLNPKGKISKKLNLKVIFELLIEFYKSERMLLLDEQILSMWVSSDGKKVDAFLSEFSFYIKVHFFKRVLKFGIKDFWVEVDFVDNVTVLKIGFYGGIPGEIQDYSEEEYEKLKRKYTVEKLEINIKTIIEGEHAPKDLKKYPYHFEYSYVAEPLVQYLENGEIDFIQTYNKRGEVLKMDHYKKGKIIKTLSLTSDSEN